MGAPLIGAAQVIVYIGAISVLILFAIMLTQTKDAPEPARLPDPGRPGGDRLGRHRDRHRARDRATDWGEVGRAAARDRPTLSRSCSPTYVLPFEVVSVLLLAAVIGGVFLAKREPGGPS